MLLARVSAAALRPEFEWYYCRGAFFHNDAHYDARLFGVWYIEGPPMQLVFPRAALRVDIAPSSVVVFDPFEVHGVLAPGSRTYAANDYQTVSASVFVGFELDINDDVADAFDIDDDVTGQVISSRTRIDPAIGGDLVGSLTQEPLQVSNQRLDTFAVLDEQAHPTFTVKDVSTGSVINRIRRSSLARRLSDKTP